MTAHLIVEKNSSAGEINKLKQKIKHELLHLNIQHATLETESENDYCEDDCN